MPEAPLRRPRPRRKIPSSAPEPRFARIAAAIGDPTRARMLAVLLSGELATAGEIAQAAGVTPQTASAHLALLEREQLVLARTQGRHRYFRLADGEVARALEALSLIAERGPAQARWQQPAWKPLKHARTCYGHLAGEVGVALLDGLLAQRWLEPAADGFTLTATGVAGLGALGLDSAALGGARLAYPCVDWSERRDHLAGPLAVALLAHGIARGWLRRHADSRAVSVTPGGRRALAPLLDQASRREQAARA